MQFGWPHPVVCASSAFDNYFWVGVCYRLASNDNLVESFFFYCYEDRGKKTIICSLIEMIDMNPAKNFSSAFPTLSWICIGICVPFSWMGHNGYLKLCGLRGLLTDLPCRSNRFFWHNQSFCFRLSDDCSSYLDFSLGADFCLVLIPIFLWRSTPRIHLVGRSVIKNAVFRNSHPSERMSAFRVPIVTMGVFL